MPLFCNIAATACALEPFGDSPIEIQLLEAGSGSGRGSVGLARRHHNALPASLCIMLVAKLQPVG